MLGPRWYKISKTLMSTLMNCASTSWRALIFLKWMAKHHLGLDLFGLVVDDVEKELLSSKATAENVTEEAKDVAKGMKGATVIIPADPVPDEQ